MKKIVMVGSLILVGFLLVGFSNFFETLPNNTTKNTNLNDSSEKIVVENLPQVKTTSTQELEINDTLIFENHIQKLYQKLELKEAGLEYESFKTAYIGYLNLQSKKQLKKEILTIIDFTKSMYEKRFWIVDMKNQILIRTEFVAHGKNSGEEKVVSLSNIVDSYQSSIGFYVTDNTYISGKNGISLFINGVDKNYNHNARRRSVVMHGAHYVNPKMKDENGNLGRSEGCPAVEMPKAKEIIEYVKEGSCLFIYFNDETYLKSSKWLNLDNGITYFVETIKEKAEEKAESIN